MNNTQISHINQLVSNDQLKCDIQLREISLTDYSENVKATLSGYFRDRTALNHSILAESNFHDEKNINSLEGEKC